ncbi:hypothetical protein [Lentzea sp. NPDC060358]|uniref:hypothetical protein n=1 Tax=Lentzea sp. NPDC060358 TaxID=3347103 RepID=UPI00364BFBE8
MSGPPPLGPGAPAAERLAAFGRARLEFLVEHAALARATLDPGRPAPIEDSPSLFHVRMLLNEAVPEAARSGALALQLVAALEGPVLLYLRAPGDSGTAPHPGTVVDDLATSWEDLIGRVCGR